MSAAVKLSSKMPADIDTNGLDALQSELVADGEELRVGIVVFDAKKYEHDVDSGANIPTVRIRRFEPICLVGETPSEIRKLLDQAAEKRTGRTPLPIESVEPDAHLDD